MHIKTATSGVVIAATLLLASCSTPKNITYFPDLTQGTIIQAEKVLDVRVKPDDKLSIVVSTQDPALSALFNLTRSGGSSGGSSASGGGNTSLYTVDSQGDIIFPVLGKLHVEGMSREELANYIMSELINRDLVKEPIVTVEFANTGIVVIGEVGSPGKYEFNRAHYTILDAIAAAGDLSLNGMRTNILVLRNIGGGKQEAYRVNLLDAQSLASSPVYYLQQDDVIYVEPNDKVKRETTPNGNSPFTPSFWISLGSTALTVITLIITLSK